MALIADRIVAAEIDRTARTLDRWDRGQQTPPGWPRPIYLNRRKYRDSEAFEIFKQGLADLEPPSAPAPEKKDLAV